MTENHNYETPAKGATDWHEALNGNFEEIDRGVEIRDRDDARTNYEAKSGAKFLATDSENVYVGDGNQWLRLATSGKNPSFDSVGTAEIYDTVSGNTYGVDELAATGSAKQPADAVVMLTGETPDAYGAYRADGSEIMRGGDASMVVQAAIDDAVSNGGGGFVKIGPGSYSLQSDIQVPSNTTVSGAGIGVTVFEATGPNQEWIPKDSTRENIVLKGFTQDGNDQGGRTGINMLGVKNSRLTQLEVLNAGGRDGNSDSTPALRVTSGTRSRIDNCRVRRSSSVSIEAAIGAVGCEIVNCVVEDGVFNSGAGFVHGISIEKSKNCRIANCYVEGTGADDFSPALNVNNADYAVCANNTVRDVAVGLYNANGPCYSNVYAHNSFLNCNTGLNVKSGNAGDPTANLLMGNVLDNCGISIGDGGDADLICNMIRNGSINVRSVQSPPMILGNVFRDCKFTVSEVRSTTGEPMIYANNYFAQESTTQSNNEPIVVIDEPYGIMTGNVFNSEQDNKTTVQVSPSNPSYWIISNNYFDESKGNCLKISGDGQVTQNIFDSGRLVVSGGAEATANHGMNGASLEVSGPDSTDGLSESYSRSGTFTGDSTAGRMVNIALTPDHVVLKSSDGTLYDVHSQFGTGYHHSAPDGEFSITDGGFTVGHNGADADPNTSGRTYTFYAH
jgi:hypothetical protein